jgi:hypothetical protein
VTFGDVAAPVAALAPSLAPPLHPPPLSEGPALQASYRSLVNSLPSALRAPAERLPWVLGLTSSPDGGWEDFVRLHPNLELPLYAAQVRDGGYCLAPEDLARYIRAHHFGGFTWLLRDRMEDRQAAPDGVLLELSELFGQRWRDAIAEATGEERLTDLLCRRSIALWRRGTTQERAALAAPGSLRVPQYASIVREKLGWIAVPSQALLLVDGDADRLESFLAAHDLYLLGLQVIDDVIDREQDRTLRGGDVPAALGCSPGALLRAAPKLVQRAAVAAAGGGFVWLASWLQAFAAATASWTPGGDVMAEELESIGILGQIEEAILGRAETPYAARPPLAAAAPAPA